MFVAKRIEGKDGRDYIEEISESDRKYKISSMGCLAYWNAYGELVYVQEDGKELPVMCGHGGSMWLCRDCKHRILKEQGDSNKERSVKGMKRYRQLISVIGDLVEDANGKWVRYEDVKEIGEAVTLEVKSVECNCEKMLNRLMNPIPLTPAETFTAEIPDKFWICPAHGYKKL